MLNNTAMKENTALQNNQPLSQSVAYGQNVLRHESKALAILADMLDERFESAISAILAIPSNGRLVISGIGKTGFVAKKISATFASIGIPSFFLHPAEAVHGDLGRVTQNDVVMLLSNSGETPEVLSIVPGLKKIGCSIIALTGNENSLLARKSNLVLPLGKTTEAGPLGLAPTTSTTAMLALGDALAMTVSYLKPITKEQFAIFHPAGSLGRTLLLVNEVMRKNDELCIVPLSMLAADVIKTITETKGRPGAAAIIDSDGILCGVFTDGDLRRLLHTKADFLSQPISQVMGRKPKTIPLGVLADEALKILSEYQIDQVIVVDASNHPVGMVDIQDLVRWNTGGIGAADY